MTDHAFCRALLTEVMIEVRKHITAQERKTSWAWRSGDHCADFHGPEGFYWYGGGCCLWDVKARGWSAWLQERGFET